MQYPKPIEQLIDSYRLLPGIGAKTAARLAFFVWNYQKKILCSLLMPLLV